MVDIDSHRIVDMVPSRDYEEVNSWLQTYPNIILVSRDGSLTYRNAINKAFPNAIQVSDRFHLFKNLTDYIQEYLKKELSTRIKINVSSLETAEALKPISKANNNRKLTLKEKYEKISILIVLGHNKTSICRHLNLDVRAYNKLVSATPEELEARFTTKTSRVQEEKLRRKQNLVLQVRDLIKQGFSKQDISRQTGLNRRTVTRYLDENFNPVHAATGQKKKGLLTPFIKEIESLLAKGIMGSLSKAKLGKKVMLAQHLIFATLLQIGSAKRNKI